MKIRSLYVSRLFNEYDYSLDLCDGLTFLHSPNGYGKSTLMHMVYSALRGDVRYLSEVPFERMDIGFEDDTSLIIENREGELTLLMQKTELESPIDADEMAALRDVTYIPPERMVIKRRDGHIASSLETYAQELYESIRSAKEESVLPMEADPPVAEMSDGELEFTAKDLKARLDFIKDAGFEPEIPSGFRLPPSRYDISVNRDGYVRLLSSLKGYVADNYGLAESIIIYKDVVNEIFINKTMSVTDTGKMMITMDNGTALQLTRLSSGERQILIMFYILLFHTAPGSLVILDEPEISLHVSWQQQLGDVFMDICRVRGVQMVVATHSPQVIHDKWDLARELKPEDA